MRGLYLLSLTIMLFLLMISSCGRKGDPIPPKEFNIANNHEGVE